MDVDDLYTSSEPLRTGERLFGKQDPWQLTAILDGPFFGEWRYVEGFRRAAEVLCEQAIRSGGDVETLTMPALFCYRHWAELRLKDLWMLGAEYRGEIVDPRRTHDLMALWRLVRPIVEPLGPPDDTEELDALEAVLHELAQDGPRGEGFRYGRRLDGEPSLPADLTHVNLRNVREVMAKASAILDGSAAMLGEAIQERRDWRGAY